MVSLGPTLLVDIGFDPKYVAASGVPPPSAAIKGIWALVDTGATECCIDGDLAKELALPVIDRRHIAGIGGKKEVNIHLAQVFVPALMFTVNGAFAAVDLAAGGQQHKALIGRTFLRYFTMIYSGSTGDVEIFS